MLQSLGRIIYIPFARNRKLVRNLTPILGFLPTRVRYYEMAFIHKSASVILPDGNVVNNERLEYLGDAILDAIVADYLFKKFPDKDEGFLTKMRSKMVKRKHLNILAYRMGINDLIVTHDSSPNRSKHLSGNAFEALIGAVYLDKGYKKTSRFIERIINHYVDLEKLRRSESDYKSKLIEYAQKNKLEVIFESHESSVDNNNIPHFITNIKMMNDELGRGIGNSKKESEQKASKMALENILDK